VLPHDADPGQRSFGEVLNDLAVADPARPAITCADVTVTRRDLDERTNALARAYAEVGVGPGSFVTIGLPNSIEFLESAIATWKLGAIPQPISPRLPQRELDAIVELINPAIVVGVDAGRVGTYPAVAAGYRPPPGTSTEPLPHVASPAWKAPTSGGSTGRPKVIVATQPAVLQSASVFAAALGIPEDGTMLATGPLDHNGPFITTVFGLLLGAHVVVMPRFDATATLDLVERYRVQWMYAVPTMMLRIWRLPEDVRLGSDLSSLERVMHMAAPCPTWLKHAWIDWLGAERVWELYGGTEVQAVTLIDGADWLRHPGSVGRPFIGEICVLDEAGVAPPRGEVGSVWMRRGEGEPASYRYLGATARSRDGGWECLGDMGRLDDEGYLYLVDRDSDLILVGGSNVYPAEVEAVLEEHPAIRTSCVVGVPDDDLGQVVHAVLELAQDATDQEILAFCAERLVRYKMPRALHRSPTPLRDEAGKVRRSAVREALIARLGPG